MKKVFLLNIIILTLTMSSAFAQTTPASETKVTKNMLYKNFPDPFAEITLIHFNIEYDSHIRLIITDKLGNEITELSDGFADKGDHYVYYKRPQNQGRGICKCIMEIYSAETNDVLFSDEIIMNYNDGNKLVLKK